MFEGFNATISNLSKYNKMSLPNALINLPFVRMVMYPIVFAYDSCTAIKSGGLNLGSFVENMNNFFSQQIVSPHRPILIEAKL